MSGSGLFNFLGDLVRSPQNWILVGLSSFLGGIWSKRILLKEDGEIRKELARFQTSLDKEKESVSRSITHQNEMIKVAGQSASGERSAIFQKQYEAIMELWRLYLGIKSEGGKFCIHHQLLTSAEKANRATYTKIPMATQDKIDESLKEMMKLQGKCLELQPMIPPSIFFFCSGLTTFYARLGVNQLTNLKAGVVPPWFGSKAKPDYSVKQLIELCQGMNLKLPELDDNPIGFDRWKTATEGYFFQEIQKFLFGSMERHLELFEGIRVATDIEAEVKANSI